MTPARVDPRVQRSRSTVIGATLELVGERGIGGITVDAVAERSGVAKTTIYRQWPDGRSLVLAAFQTLLSQPEDPDTGTLRGDLREALGSLADALRESPAAPLMAALIDAAERDERFAELHRQEATQRLAVIHRILERGRARGELPPDADLAAVLDLVSGPLFHRRYVSGVGPGRTLDRAFAEQVVDLALAAVGTVRDP